ncbi:bifunctional DNA-formamidopyrimidine glycosylase/DNA-(apurinic or apyrimidinic site) lyase [Kordiimonas marina]|uniref:bifunctional DNA-formamidopyrimidine glycosylase/DNA-(apurinic or apyrimidinic site) lyase n=1 Tax=Kordiimonas marina TaxID=2872312 RepID=UPI001FF6EC92|nr:bifunctional DNA-formamidopyrimidine glycosylase/DNA-(apurinic or apyrimidinic site) lyase [Kordiimonas marina]MCJ9430010.1 bifunctional DNA-formamidopyrimidine glycosylase/DNA-(apurinic or apyrimidinic site) lyase [Kordiimonas marina]
MPELPEVETVRRGLLPVLEGATITEAVARVPKLRVDIPADFSARLMGNKVERLTRRSKYILAECADGLVVIIHLGMSGRMTIQVPGADMPAPEKHDHILLTTDAGARIVYNDARRFGLWVFTDRDSVQDHPLIRGIGPEPLGNEFNVDVLNAGLTGRKSPIKAALLDQKLVAGLGNIYVCEALWRAHIHPERPAHTVAGKDADRLVPIIRDVLSEAIKAGGSTLKDYAQVDGELGYFQHSFKAYGREGEPCHTPGCDGMVERIVQSNRSSFFCPKCQH